MVLNKFCNDDNDNRIETYTGIQFRYLKLTLKKLGAVRQYNHYVITSQPKGYCLDPWNGIYQDMELQVRADVN